MYQVIKRDGKVVDFNITRISNAITKAFEATQIPYSDDIINMLSLMVTADYSSRIRSGRIDVETIQDSVETVLQKAGYSDVAKAYILYRKQREKVRNVNSALLNYKDYVAPNPPETYEKLTRMMRHAGQAYLLAGNRVTPFTEFPAMLHDMLCAIHSARHHIHVQFYIFMDDE